MVITLLENHYLYLQSYMQLNTTVPWGRSLQEYQDMFLLRESELQSSILACADGPASFNTEARKQGAKVTSVDPLYQFSAEEIKTRINVVAEEVIGQVKAHQDDFFWTAFANPEALYQQRMRSMQLFLDDYAMPASSPFYISAQLPELPFANKQFDLALCSHFLFLYSEHFDAQFHLDSMHELCRVASQVRVYPLVGLDNTPSPHLGLIVKELSRQGHEVKQQTVDYQFQKGATQMLVVNTAP